ncbi:hypothetical protein CK203_043330 [Vitis vinifera]|uniref:Uncharacterized protein n=1 Tax=Vitis vinifera TaxID=29760 RepID=A0A438GY77_VITVI|nr:hypothetical protein CK203_043330 [Vitis vinifera]
MASGSRMVWLGLLVMPSSLWWEVKPGVSEVVPVIRNETGKEREVRDDGEGDSCADFKMEKRRKFDVTRASQQTIREEDYTFRACEPSIVGSGPVVKGRPTIEKLNGIRACDGGSSRLWRTRGEMFGSQLGSSSQALNLTVITDEALMEEASRVSDRGQWFRGSRGAVLGPLRIILADGREAEVSDLAGREFRAFEEGVRGGFGKGFPRGCGGEGQRGGIVLAFQ